MITRIEAFGYRCFAQLSVDLGRYHVLAGTNGAGKTTLLDIPVLLGDMLGQQRAVDALLRLQDSRTTARAHTVAEVIHQGRGNRAAVIASIVSHRSITDSSSVAGTARPPQSLS